jgi:alpha-tubulin suppressor-like RCC1 family protein
VVPPAGRGWGGGATAHGELGTGGPQNSVTPAQVAGLSNIVAIASTSATAYAVRGDGALLAWGENSGLIGDGSSTDVLTPIVIPGLSDVVGVGTTTNDLDTWALHGDGTVSGWGDEDLNGLGNGQSSGLQATPVTIPGLHNIVQLVTGNTTAYALGDDGTVWAWGIDNFGQVGDGEVVPPPAPVQVATITGVEALGASFYSGFAILGDGTVAGWGGNSDYALGDGTTNERTTPVTISGLSHIVGLAVSPDGGTGYAVEDQLATTILPPH